MFQDLLVLCKDCNMHFTFSAGEQEFFSNKSLTNLPKRCHNCRLEQRARRSGKALSGITTTICAGCGSLTKVPFQPKGHSPVYCTSCFVAARIRDESAFLQEALCS